MRLSLRSFINLSLIVFISCIFNTYSATPTSKKQKKPQDSKKPLNIQNNYKNFIICFVLIAIVLICIVVIALNKKSKTNKVNTKTNKIKTKPLTDLPHVVDTSAHKTDDVSIPDVWAEVQDKAKSKHPQDTAQHMAWLQEKEKIVSAYEERQNLCKLQIRRLEKRLTALNPYFTSAYAKNSDKMPHFELLDLNFAKQSLTLNFINTEKRIADISEEISELENSIMQKVQKPEMQSLVQWNLLEPQVTEWNTSVKTFARLCCNQYISWKDRHLAIFDASISQSWKSLEDIFKERSEQVLDYYSFASLLKHSIFLNKSIKQKQQELANMRLLHMQESGS